MGVTRITAGLLLLLASACGFGNWSDDDLLFDQFDVVPKGERLKMNLPGAELVEQQLNSVIQGAQNGDCEGANRDRITCHARRITGALNKVTFDILKLVDGVIQQRPTHKAAGKRIWGPYYNAQNNRTFRFEMQVLRDGSDVEFKYCLHGAVGKKDGLFADRNLECGKEVDGFIEVLNGKFFPSTDSQLEERVRSNGTGEVRLDFNKLIERGLAEDPRVRGVLDIGYMFEGCINEIALTITDAVHEETGLPSNGAYTYTNAADGVCNGSGAMTLQLLTNLGRCDHCIFGDELETMRVAARWKETRASLVEVWAEGGNLPPDTTHYGYECTNADLDFVAGGYTWDSMSQTGNRNLCPYPPSR